MKRSGFGGTASGQCLHQRLREEEATLQKFVAVHASVYNHFDQERHLYSRIHFKLNRAAAALAEWRQLLSA
jgi:hypothetical protein